MTSSHDTYSEPCLLLKIQTYSDIVTSCSNIFSHIVVYLEPCVIFPYSEPLHIYNSGIFRTQDIFRTLSKPILAYSVSCVTLAFWKTCFIQNFVIFRISTLRNSYSNILNNDNINFFLHFFHTFQRDLKRHICFLTTITSISMLNFNTLSLKKAL